MISLPKDWVMPSVDRAAGGSGDLAGALECNLAPLRHVKKRHNR